ncbi:hypothetical protein JOC24_006421 [Streptomyces sp. HB132]|nr:hypothetical protein [Streptomyces sp. HB132]
MPEQALASVIEVLDFQVATTDPKGAVKDIALEVVRRNSRSPDSAEDGAFAEHAVWIEGESGRCGRSAWWPFV